jgi:hypothetical protein
MNPDTIGGTVRTLLATLGGVAIGFGYVTAEDVGQIAAAGGALASAVALVWSIVNKFRQRQAVQVALMTPPPAQPK